MNLQTPLCIKIRPRNQTSAADKVLVQKPDFATLFGALHRRLTLLCSQFGEYAKQDDENFHALRPLAQEVQTVMQQLRQPTWERFSRRSGDTYAMSGLLGSILYTGPLTPFAPLWPLAEATHIGSDTSFGLGRIQFQRLQSADESLRAEHQAVRSC